MRVSLVIEWANTRLRGTERANMLLDTLARQWQEVVAGHYPATLPRTAGRFLDGLHDRAELVIVSGTALSADLEEDLQKRLCKHFVLSVHVAEGLEYYPLKNLGARLATGDLLLFVDSDVLPDEGWLAHLLGSFAKPGIDVVCGQTYVASSDLVARAFALSWIFSLRDDSGGLVQPRRFYSNNIAFRTDIFRRTGFPSIGGRSRGACRLLRQDLDRLGTAVWENRQACVDHAPPATFRHIVVRALAHGRDHYMTVSEERSLRGTKRSWKVAARRLRRGFHRTFRYWRRVGLRRYEIPAVLTIILVYYSIFALGGLLTFIHPRAMARHFRV